MTGTANAVAVSPIAVSKLTVLVPVYNSEATLGRLVDAVVETLGPRYQALEMVLVNDGSKDGSHQVALAACERHPEIVRYVRLARNFGEHNAVMCGLHHVTGDCVAIIDDDFQNPVSEISVLVDKLAEGYDVVYSYYADKRHSRFRNLGSRFNGWVASRLLPVPEGLYLSSFKVMSAFLVRTVIDYQGPYPYLDGLVLRSTDAIAAVEVKHDDRAEGRSGYTLRRLLRLWLNMFTGFSVHPLRVASLIGAVMALVGLLMAAFFVTSWALGGIFSDRPIPPGWASIIVSITLFAGIQLLVLGVFGEYLGRSFLTQNRTPQFIVRETHGVGKEEGGE